MKPRVGGDATLPNRTFLGIERIVRHHDLADIRQLEHLGDVALKLLRFEERASLVQTIALRGKTESVQHRHYASCRFRYRRVLDKQRPPDCVRLGALRERPVFVGSDVRRPEKLRLQIVIRHQIIDAP